MVISIAVSTLSGEVANIRCSRGTSMRGLKQMLKAHLMISKHKQRLFAGEVEWTDEGVSVGQFLRGKARIMTVILSAKPCLVCTQEACRLCERCGWAFYCTTSCQAQDWKNHKISALERMQNSQEYAGRTAPSSVESRMACLILQ